LPRRVTFAEPIVHTSPELLDEDARYSQVSPAAVLALVLGLASPLAFIGPGFYLAPAAAIGMALLALSKIRRSDGALTGQTLARIALALALGCVSAALVRESVRDSLLQRQAVDAARRWMKLLADGRNSEASAMLTKDSAGRFVPSEVIRGEKPISQQEVMELIEQGLESDLLSRAVEGQADPGELQGVSGPFFSGPKATLIVNFRVKDAVAGKHRPVEFNVSRSPAYELEGQPWRIESWTTDAAQ
jgi:hypothetical protein